jgi:sensor domain CHASE-containing protein
LLGGEFLTLYRKSYIAIGVMFLCLIVALYCISAHVMLGSAINADQHQAVQELGRIKQGVDAYMNDLARITRDHAALDDTRAFLNHRNPTRISHDFNDQSFQTLDINYVVIADSRGRVAYSRGFDLSNPQEIDVPTVLESLPSRDVVVTGTTSHAAVSGMIRGPKGCIAFSISQIFRDTRKRRSAGSILLGRQIDLSVIRNVSKLTSSHLDMQVARPWADQPRLGVHLGGNTFYSRVLNRHSMVGYVLLHDVNGSPLLVLKTVLYRMAYVQAVRSEKLLLISLLILALVFMCGTVLLARRINRTESRKVEKALRDSREILDVLMKYSPDGIVVVDRDLTVSAASAYALELFCRPGESGGFAVSRGESWFIIRAGEDTPAAIDELPLTRAVKHGETVSGEEWVIRYRDRDEVHILCDAAPINAADGSIIGGVLSFTDLGTIWVEREALKSAYDRERQIVEILQHALMPETLDNPPGYEIAGRYKPAWKHPEVGGDFYDVFDVGDGRLALIIGDVSGKGLEAWGRTAMAKHMIRAYAHLDPNPESVLQRLNEAMHDYTHPEQFVTIFYGLLDPLDNCLVYANGGHNEPILYDSSERDHVSLPNTGLIVGIQKDVEYESRIIRFAPGDYLLLYTDGITECGRVDQHLDMRGLCSILEAFSGEECPDEIADRVLGAAVHASGGTLRDDAAVLVVKANPELLASSSQDQVSWASRRGWRRG